MPYHFIYFNMTNIKIDTLKINQKDIDSLLNTKLKTVVIIQKEKNDETFFESSVFTTLIVPILVLTFSIIFTKYSNKKREKKETKKIDSETRKIDEEIKNLKSSFQPLVLSTIQKTQDFLLHEKIEVLKNLVEFRNSLLDVTQSYHEGQGFIGDVSEYYNHIYMNISKHIINKFETSICSKRYFFTDIIINDITSISSLLNTIHEEKERLESINPMNSYEAPNNFDKTLKKLEGLISLLLENIRTDLHLNNTFAQDFLKKYTIEHS